MNAPPFRVWLDNGETVNVFASRALAVAADGPDGCVVWHFDPQGIVEKLHIQAEAAPVRDALGLSNPLPGPPLSEG